MPLNLYNQQFILHVIYTFFHSQLNKPGSFQRELMMITLEQLPSIVTHQIIGYLPYEDLLSLSQSSRYFQERVTDQVLETLRLPGDFSDLSVNNRLRSRPVLNLSVIWSLQDSLVNNLEYNIETIQTLLDRFNLSKVGSLTVKILPEEDYVISWASTGSR